MFVNRGDFDFGGWATRNDVVCDDNRVIRKNAFAKNDGQKVPLVWMHDHNTPSNVLGHAVLENRPEGVYAYVKFNTDTEEGRKGKSMVEHGDVDSLSICANQLKQVGNDVVGGNIREVSLVLSGANPLAHIDDIITHGATGDRWATISMEEPLSFPEEDGTFEHLMYAEPDTTIMHSSTGDNNKQNYNELFDQLTDEQKEMVYYLVGQAASEATKDDEDNEGDNNKDNDNKKGGPKNMLIKHNAFENNSAGSLEIYTGGASYTGAVIDHAGVGEIVQSLKRGNSLKSALNEFYAAHDVSNPQDCLSHSVTNMDYLFPDARSISNTPEFLTRKMGWVDGVLNGVYHVPFSRIKSKYANLTEDDARALGYIKGNKKKEEVFSILKRTTSATTIYKKQKFDRDDLIEITDFDYIGWIRQEMLMMLREELARAILIGDGRSAISEDHIKTDCIRPIMDEDDLYSVKKVITFNPGDTADVRAKVILREIIKSRKDYRGSGNPIFYTTEDFLADCLLLESTTGERLYKNEQELATAMRVSGIVTVPVMENVKTSSGSDLTGIMVNLVDYTVGTDRGGEVTAFDDFDIDYNQQKYLIETRCSGAMTKPYGAVVFSQKTKTA